MGQQPSVTHSTSVTHSSFVIERNYRASPERVFAAFSDPVRKSRWMGGPNRELVDYKMDFRMGGAESARYQLTDGPMKGRQLTNHTTYQDIIPNRRIVFAYTMSFDQGPFSASLATVELIPEGSGTNLVFTEQGAYFENSDGPQLREKGWSGLLDRVASELD